MTPERWQRITTIFHAALERAPAERSDFLNEACAADEELRGEVEALLGSQTGAADIPPSMPAESSPPEISRRMPWWMIALAASFVATFVFFWYLTIVGPADPFGIGATFGDNAMEIHTLEADSVFAKGGLRVGDRVLTIDTRPMRVPLDWTAAAGNMQVEQQQVWEVSRQSETVRLEVVHPPARFRQRLIDGYLQVLSLLVSAFLLGMLIVWKRPHDPVARIGAWFLLTASVAFGLPPGWAVVWRDLPVAVQGLLWIPQISRFVLEGIFLTFFLLFPRRLLTKRWLWLVVWTPVLATLPWRAMAFYSVIHPDRSLSVPTWILQAGFARTIVYLAAGILVLAVGYRRVLDVNEKRRVRVLMAGTAVGVTAALITAWFDGFRGRLNGPFLFAIYAVIPLACACPLSLAYAVLRHHVLDIRVIIRQGLQYALARGAVIGVVPLLGGLFILDLALNSEETIASVMGDRGWIYASLAGLALLTYIQRKQWLDALDRRFFRERYNAQRVLREVVEEIREARDLERVAQRVMARIETALHPEFVSLMVREPDEPNYRPLTTFPSGHSTLFLPAHGKLAALMRAMEKPLEGLLSDSAWSGQRLPPEESQWIRRAQIDFLLPIAVDPARKEAVLALGRKRSDEPYTREDRDLLETIASSLALLLEQSGPRRKLQTETFGECPECGACYDSTTTKCASDGGPLSTTQLSRTLAGRYRLERRRGRGGMGTVYEAMDSALERRVAIKVIRDDWVASVDAAQRFRREARAGAAFAHPNVVTVFDYGVEGDTRGFLVMELLGGHSLRDEIRRAGKLDPDRTLWIMRGVCSAVEAAHRRQLIHRDLKPENVFLAAGEYGTGEVVKVLDFGVAKSLAPVPEPSARETALTNTGILIGTPAYMSPEQLLGGAPDVQWDLWASAVVTYEALTGELPFNSTSPGEWRSAVLSGRFTPLEGYIANPPSKWRSLFSQVFHPEPASRPRSAADFLSRLEEALSD